MLSLLAFVKMRLILTDSLRFNPSQSNKWFFKLKPRANLLAVQPEPIVLPLKWFFAWFNVLILLSGNSRWCHLRLVMLGDSGAWVEGAGYTVCTSSLSLQPCSQVRSLWPVRQEFWRRSALQGDPKRFLRKMGVEKVNWRSLPDKLSVSPSAFFICRKKLMSS